MFKWLAKRAARKRLAELREYMRSIETTETFTWTDGRTVERHVYDERRKHELDK